MLLRNIFGVYLLVGNGEVGPGFVEVGSLNRITTALQKFSWLSFQRNNVGVAVDAGDGICFVTEGHALGRRNAGTWLIDSHHLIAGHGTSRDSTIASSIDLLGSWNLSNRGGTWLGGHRISSGRGESRKSRSGPLTSFGHCVIPEHAAIALIDQLVEVSRQHGFRCKASEEILH